MDREVYYKAKLDSVPAKWNSFCYIVKTEEPTPIGSVFYFSEAAKNKPINKNVGDEGYLVLENNLFHHWKDSEVQEEYKE